MVCLCLGQVQYLYEASHLVLLMYERKTFQMLEEIQRWFNNGSKRNSITALVISYCRTGTLGTKMVYKVASIEVIIMKLVPICVLIRSVLNSRVFFRRRNSTVYSKLHVHLS